MKRSIRLVLSSIALTLGLAASAAGCAVDAAEPPSDEAVQSSAEALLTDAQSLQQRADGLFDVVCRDGRVEKGVTPAQIVAGALCNAQASASADPFDDASCAGPPMTKAEALSHFAVAATSAKLGRYQTYWRTRDCTALTGCTEWVVRDPGWAYVNTGAGFYTINGVGDIALEIDPSGTDIGLSLTTDPFRIYYHTNTKATLRNECGSVLSGVDSKGLLTCKPNFNSGDDLVYIGDNKIASFPAKLTSSCYRAKLTGSAKRTGNPAVTVEMEAVLLGTF